VSVEAAVACCVHHSDDVVVHLLLLEQDRAERQTALGSKFQNFNARGVTTVSSPPSNKPSSAAVGVYSSISILFALYCALISLTT